MRDIGRLSNAACRVWLAASIATSERRTFTGRKDFAAWAGLSIRTTYRGIRDLSKLNVSLPVLAKSASFGTGTLFRASRRA